MSRRDSVVAAFLAALIGAVALRHGPRVIDDAYITCRYARNLADGAGLLFNVGERVLGTSAPLFAILLAALSKLTGIRDFPLLAFLLGAGAVPPLVFLTYSLARRFTTLLFSALAVLLAFAEPVVLWIFASGLETPLYLLGLVVSLDLLARGRDASALVVAGLLPFLHPEAVLLFPALVVAIRFRDGRWPVRATVLGLIPPAVLAAYLTLSFGSPVPHSVVAKSRAFAPEAFQALAALLGVFKATIFPFDLVGDVQRAPTGAIGAGKVLTYLLAAGFLFLAARGARDLRRSPTALALALFLATYGLVFAFFNPLLFPWYLPPFRLAVAVLFASALGGAAGSPGVRRSLAYTWAGVIVAASLWRLAALRPYDPATREGVYRKVVESLDLKESDVVAGPEIGALGYFTRARIFDTVGLVTPGALRFYDEKWRAEARRGEHRPGAIPPALLREIEPGLVIAGRNFLRDAETIDPAVLAAYEEVARYESPVFPDGGVVVMRRREGYRR